jgi:hypothetical protein
VFWITRPPYFQWVAAVLVVSGLLWVEFRPIPTVNHPFVVSPVATGELIEPAVEWRTIPVGVLVPVTDLGIAARNLDPSSPLVPGDVAARGFVPPAGWWAIDLDLPVGAVVGRHVQLVVLPAPGQPAIAPIPGVIVAPRSRLTASPSQRG